MEALLDSNRNSGEIMDPKLHLNLNPLQFNVMESFGIQDPSESQDQKSKGGWT